MLVGSFLKNLGNKIVSYYDETTGSAHFEYLTRSPKTKVVWLNSSNRRIKPTGKFHIITIGNLRKLIISNARVREAFPS